MFSRLCPPERPIKAVSQLRVAWAVNRRAWVGPGPQTQAWIFLCPLVFTPSCEITHSPQHVLTHEKGTFTRPKLKVAHAAPNTENGHGSAIPLSRAGPSRDIPQSPLEQTLNCTHPPLPCRPRLGLTVSRIKRRLLLRRHEAFCYRSQPRDSSSASTAHAQAPGLPAGVCIISEDFPDPSGPAA